MLTKKEDQNLRAIGDRIEDLIRERQAAASREGVHLLESDIARALEISPAAFSNYKNGENMPGGMAVIKICQYFGVSADWLLGLSDGKIITPDVKCAAATTGLTEEAVQILENLNTMVYETDTGKMHLQYKDKERTPGYLLSKMVEHPTFPGLTHLLSEALHERLRASLHNQPYPPTGPQWHSEVNKVDKKSLEGVSCAEKEQLALLQRGERLLTSAQAAQFLLRQAADQLSDCASASVEAAFGSLLQKYKEKPLANDEVL